MTTFYPFLSLGDVYDYLPKFDPDYDLQVGDWVMIKPWRASVLLSPLIAAWESRSQAQHSAVVDSSCAPAPQFKLNQLLPEPLNLRRRSLAWDSEGARATTLRLPRLAPLSMARARFCQRKRGHVVRTSAKRDEDCGGEYMEAETDDLFFHIRLGLLTPSRPYIFGGLDIVEVLAWPPEDDSAEEDVASDGSSDSQHRPEPCTMYLNLLTGETLTRDEAVDRATKAFAYSSSTPSWSSPIEEAAEKEWQQWVARRSSKCPQPQPCN